VKHILRKGLSVLLVVSMCLTVDGPTVAAPASAATHPASTNAPTGALTIDNETGATWTCSFNPYTAVGAGVAGLSYEPLIYVNTLQSGKTTPWLATSYSWSDGNRVLTFTIRRGVKWNDGAPFSAADVLYTFQLLKSNPGLDLNAIWSVLSSVAQQGDNVVFTFKTAAVPYFYYVADQTPIVPEHTWSHIKNPVTFLDSNPVGTGPYTVSRCTPENITYTANRQYWQPGLPKIATVYYPSFTNNSAANLFLASGQAQWGGQYIPNIHTFYLSKSPYNQFWAPPVVNLSLFINQTVAPLNDVAVRRAMAYAISPQQVSLIGEDGEQPAANQTGVVLPTFTSWYDAPLAAKYAYGYDPAKAISILEKDGYKRGSNGIFAKDGKELSFTAITVGGSSDWVADLHVAESELATAGISVTTGALSGTGFADDLNRGEFQLAYSFEAGGPTPYYELRQLLYSKVTAPIGQAAATNFERWKNPATDRLIDEYASTTSVAAEYQVVDQLEQVMLQDVPVIPLSEFVDWYQYNTKDFTGWPTQSDQYAQPAPYNVPDMEVVVLHLTPK
jgi:peptide/nickel transport system substrate-binding protein